MDKLTLDNTRDFPMTTNTLAFMQAAYAIFERFGYIGGDNFIVSGCEVTDTSAAPGYMFLKGKLMPFLGGTIPTHGYVQIVTVVTDVAVDAGVRQQTSYRAEFGQSSNSSENVAWASIAKQKSLQDKVDKVTGKELVDPTAVVQTGMLMPWAGLSTNKPDGWLICNGAAVSRTTYADLFAIIGIKYGSGNGVDTFNLPDMGGYVPVGATKDTNVTTPSLSNGYGVAQKVGEDKHTLSISEMPSHSHALPNNWNEGGAGHIASGGNNDEGAISDTTGSTGGGSAHENRQPSLAMYYIIKA